MKISSVIVINSTQESDEGTYIVTNPNIVNFHLAVNSDVYITLDNFGVCTDIEEGSYSLKINDNNRSVVHFINGITIIIDFTIEGKHNKLIIKGGDKSVSINGESLDDPKLIYQKILEVLGIDIKKNDDQNPGHLPSRDKQLASHFKQERDNLSKR